MKTSNFANNQRYKLKGISISRYPANRQGFSGPEFTPLMPSAELLKAYKEGLGWAEYSKEYKWQLDCLNPIKVWDRLHSISFQIGAAEPILLCYESAVTLMEKPCHRRLVAQWLQSRVHGAFVPEWKNVA